MKTLSSRRYRGYTIEHRDAATPWLPEDGGKFWWIVELEWDEPTLREAKAHIDAFEAFDSGLTAVCVCVPDDLNHLPGCPLGSHTSPRSEQERTR